MNRREMAGLGLAVALVGLVAAWEPDIPAKRVENMTKNIPIDRYVSSSRGARPEVLGARSVIVRPTPTVAASPTPTAVSLGSFKVTSYSSCDVGMRCDGITYSGEPARWGVVAVDVRVIPLRTRLIIDGLGEFVALDTGNGVIGRHIDIWHADRQDALRFGVQTRGVRRVTNGDVR